MLCQGIPGMRQTIPPRWASAPVHHRPRWTSAGISWGHLDTGVKVWNKDHNKDLFTSPKGKQKTKQKLQVKLAFFSSFNSNSRVKIGTTTLYKYFVTLAHLGVTFIILLPLMLRTEGLFGKNSREHRSATVFPLDGIHAARRYISCRSKCRCKPCAHRSNG